MPGIDFAALRDQVRIQDVPTLVGFRHSSCRGTILRGRWPFGCSDDPRALAVDAKIDRFYSLSVVKGV